MFFEMKNLNILPNEGYQKNCRPNEFFLAKRGQYFDDRLSILLDDADLLGNQDLKD